MGVLNKKGISASRISQDEDMAPEGVLVEGYFVRLNEGDPLKSAAVGFGQGEAQFELKVTVTRLAQEGERTSEALDMVSAGKHKGPGGLLGLAAFGNPYALAAKFVMAKHATEDDMRKLGVQVADAVQKDLQK